MLRYWAVWLLNEVLLCGHGACVIDLWYRETLVIQKVIRDTEDIGDTERHWWHRMLFVRQRDTGNTESYSWYRETLVIQKVIRDTERHWWYRKLFVIQRDTGDTESYSWYRIDTHHEDKYNLSRQRKFLKQGDNILPACIFAFDSQLGI